MSEIIPEDVIQEMVDNLVLRAADDWIMLVEVDDVVRSGAAKYGLGLDGPARIRTGVELIRRGSEAGFIRPGNVIDAPPGFIPWDVDLPDALERIERGWQAAGEHLQLGDVCWLENSPTGDAHAEVVRSRTDSA
jgi:hypothetical protein